MLCQFCNKSKDTKRSLLRHIEKCPDNPKNKVKAFCRFCNKLCKTRNSHKSHERCCPCNPNKWKLAEYKRGRAAWNRGLTSATDPRLKHTEEEKIRIGLRSRGRPMPQSAKDTLSRKAKERGWGGITSKRRVNYRKVDGTFVHLHSSYEYMFATILDSLQVEWIRPPFLLWKDHKGIEHKYYADFKVGNIYIDTKNDYLAVVDLPKIEAVRTQNSVDLRIFKLGDIIQEKVVQLSRDAGYSLNDSALLV